jgi:hypothetical protein
MKVKFNHRGESYSAMTNDRDQVYLGGEVIGTCFKADGRDSGYIIESQYYDFEAVVHGKREAIIQLCQHVLDEQIAFYEGVNKEVKEVAVVVENLNYAYTDQEVSEFVTALFRGRSSHQSDSHHAPKAPQS